jgi:menaquinone-dependent protoporphyrinogen oxidase
MAVRVLVAYATKMGSTQEVAEAIAAVLRARGHAVDVASVRDVKALGAWDAVVIGSALYAAHWQREVNRFVARQREALAARRVWVFSSGPLDRALAAADLPINPSAAELLAGIPIEGHRTFGGRLRSDAEGVDAQILRTHAVGDFRDWAVIRTWAASIAEALES